METIFEIKSIFQKLMNILSIIIVIRINICYMSLKQRRSLGHKPISAIKQETRYQMFKRADMMRDEFEKYLTWKMALQHGNAISGVLMCAESANLILVYKKRNVQTGEHIRSKPMAPIEAIKLMKSRIILKCFL